MTRDIVNGIVEWRGFGVINPFAEAGGLVDLDAYPRLRRYLEARKDEIANRHCAQKTPAHWYRTIDRITPSLTKRPKLLVPDIKGEAHIVFEEGKYYPHHNLYFILRGVGLAGASGSFVVRHRAPFRGDICNANAWRFLAVSSPVSAAHPGPEVGRCGNRTPMRTGLQPPRIRLAGL